MLLEKKIQSFKKTKYIKFNKPMEIMLCEFVTLHVYVQCEQCILYAAQEDINITAVNATSEGCRA